MSHGFLPRTDLALLAWARSFAQRISLAPGDYGLSPEQAAQFSASTDDFAAKLQLCEPQIRNKVAVAGKNAARAALKANAKLLSNLINGQPSVTNSQKCELGLNVRKAPTAKPAPSSAPCLSVAPAQGQNAVTVQLGQAEAPRRGRPRTAIGAMIFTYIGDEAPADARAWRFQALASSTSIDIAFESELPPGTKVWISASWIGTRKQTGPMAAPIFTHLFGGGVGASTSLRMAA